MVAATVTTSGPIFHPSSFAKYERALEEELGDMAVEMIQSRLDRVLKNPTGYYKSKVKSSRPGGNVVVSDSGVVYGPWLEGVSSRNRTTRFKGYKTFRQVFLELDKKVPSVASKLVHRYLE